MTVTVEHPTLGPLRMTNSPYEFLGSPAAIRLPPPTLGQHTIEILAELGCTRDDTTKLLERGVVA